MNTPKENFDMLKEMANEGYEATRELADINLRTWNTMLDKQLDMLNVWLDTGIKQIELGAEAKDYKDYLANQTTLTKEFGDRLMAGGRDAISAGSEVQNAYRAWYEKSVQSMNNYWDKAHKQTS